MKREPHGDTEMGCRRDGRGRCRCGQCGEANGRCSLQSARRPVRRSAGSSFCSEYAPECETKAVEARDVVLSTKAWKDLLRINKWVNDTVKPVTIWSIGVWSSAGTTPMTVTATARTMCCSSAGC